MLKQLISDCQVNKQTMNLDSKIFLENLKMLPLEIGDFKKSSESAPWLAPPLTWSWPRVVRVVRLHLDCQMGPERVAS